MRGWLLAAAAAGAVLFLAVLALLGGRPGGGMVAFEPKGFLAAVPPAAIRDVEVREGGRLLRFHRGAGEAWDGVPDATAAALDAALSLLRVTAPERNMTAAELAGAPLIGFDLDPPPLSVTTHAQDGTALRIGFGALNPLGLSRYALVEGREGVWLVPDHLPQAWEAVARLP